MNKRCKGALQLFRERAGLKQEEVAHGLNISVHTLSNYESYSLNVRNHMPPEEIVLKMADVYMQDFTKSLYMKILYLYETNLIFRSIFTNVELMDLPTAFIKYQAEAEDVRELDCEMRKVILDNQIDEHEMNTFDIFLKELMESAMSNLSLAFSAIEKAPVQIRKSNSKPNPKKHLIMNERRPTSYERERLFARG